MLDETDRRLLALLREDARQPVTRLAQLLDISRAVVHSRIDRLEQDGIIEGYTVRVGAGHKHRLIVAQVMIKAALKLARQTEEELAAIPELSALHAISGEYDLIAVVEAETVSQLNSLIDQIGALDGVERTTSSIILATKILR
jgi:DNA-binding Lrp family transcriptional regulator